MQFLSGNNIHRLVNKRVGIENAEIQAVANATAFSCGNTLATRITKSAHIYFEKFKKLKFSKWNDILMLVERYKQ